MGTFGAYWRSVARRAWADTVALFPFGQDKAKATANLVIFLIASLVLFIIGGAAPVIDKLNNFVAGGAAMLVVFTACYLMNFIAAPYRIDREKSSEIEMLRQKRMSRESRHAIAQELREKIAEIDEVNVISGGVLDGTTKAIRGMEWSDAVIEIMRKAELPEDEIHMFETIARIPGQEILYAHDAENRVVEALTAKRNKLRSIVNRLLKD